eukprot:355929-Chlamydomonas_euryale.AAC.5
MYPPGQACLHGGHCGSYAAWARRPHMCGAQCVKGVSARGVGHLPDPIFSLPCCPRCRLHSAPSVTPRERVATAAALARLGVPLSPRVARVVAQAEAVLPLLKARAGGRLWVVMPAHELA